MNEALRAACFAVAKSTMWDKRPTSVGDIDRLADAFYARAIEHKSYLDGRGRDVAVLVRAVQYLADTHAIPPMREDERWFEHSLQVLIELACPNSGGNPSHEAFYRDIEQGIAESRTDFEANSST